MTLTIKGKEKCKWDLVSLGEVMVRFDPGEKRIWTTRSFDVYEGGGEYNVARGLKRCFGMDTAVVTAFADNPVGRLVQDLIYQGGVDQSLVKWVKYDGVGRTVRNGLNFTELGSSNRAKSIGKRSLAKWERDGSTPAGFSALFQRRLPRWRLKPCRRHANTGQSCRTT